MAATIRWAILGALSLALLPATSDAQTGHSLGSRLRLFNSQPTPTEISNHLNGYYAGNHRHGGYGLGGGANYGYGGGAGSTYNGGFFFPGYGNTYGLYPYGSGYNYSSPNFAPPAALVYPAMLAPSGPVDAATGLPVLPPAQHQLPASTPALPLAP